MTKTPLDYYYRGTQGRKPNAGVFILLSLGFAGLPAIWILTEIGVLSVFAIGPVIGIVLAVVGMAVTKRSQAGFIAAIGINVLVVGYLVWEFFAG